MKFVRLLPVVVLFVFSLSMFSGCTGTGGIDASNPNVTAVETVAANAVVSIANAEVDSLIKNISKTHARLAPNAITSSQEKAEARARKERPSLPAAEVHRLVAAVYKDRLKSP
jgi:hypothetical protein